MDFRQVLTQALVGRFGDRDLRLSTASDLTAVFPAQHADVGDVTVSTPGFAGSSIGEIASATIAIGHILSDTFYSLDTHLPAAERVDRVTRDVVRFLEHLFADRLLIWQSADDAHRRGWRECSEAEQFEPLVMDDRTYDVYLWSGPLPQWRATTAAFRRRAIRDERDYQILRVRLEDQGESALHGAERELARELVAEYERRTV
jgi:hypothetical protein